MCLLFILERMTLKIFTLIQKDYVKNVQWKVIFVFHPPPQLYELDRDIQSCSQDLYEQIHSVGFKPWLRHHR